MPNKKSLIRQSHFLGTKIRNLRKRNNLTIEDLSARCIRIDPESAPSVSYLSMIERGKRTPSETMLETIGQVFQKDIQWFLDDKPDNTSITPDKGRRGGIAGIALEPKFLFSNENLQIAIPELLSQAGIAGRQFAHLLIRAHQEQHQNHFPDLERAAEEIGNKLFPMQFHNLEDLVKHLGMQIQWFEQSSQQILDETGACSNALISSYFQPPNQIFINKMLEKHPSRLKYDLAVHIGHRVLHQQTNDSFVLSIGGGQGSRFDDKGTLKPYSSSVDPQDTLTAWRDFESSFFAGALLCPKVPFRQMLDRQGYEIDIHKTAGVSPSVAMRRMTAVSPYPHWHYFDAYSPGKLKAVYRGNGIPLPWGNMRTVEDPCQHWAVFQMLNTDKQGSSAQLSILDVNQQPRIYCCESIRTQDLAGNNHVLCAGIDLNPAIEAQGENAQSIADELKAYAVHQGGKAKVPYHIRTVLESVSRILNINWVSRGLDNRATLICSRGNVCPRTPSCYS